MSESAEKLCPICTEEMDFTDQQLKPCKCGYEMCVYCWHHIMEMAEKDGKEGQCPVCRTPYDKERIVRVAENCKKMVAEINLKRKQKKPKGPEAKKNLTDVRVLRPNLVYVSGIPQDLAKEDILKRREYFGQYGKVLKVSLARTANGVILLAPNNGCCVYISYSKECEAARCIQSVHGFVLDGKSLKASFGTTKYCHAWLKNVPCYNQDCWYLHDFGTQENSYTQDELASAFERSKDHQNIGVTNNLYRRPGKGLPPPTDECSKSLAAKSLVHQPSNIMGNEAKGSCAEDSRRAVPARAPWVMEVAPSVSPTTSSPSSERPSYKNPETSNDLRPHSSEVVSKEISTHNVRSIISAERCKVDTLVLTKQRVDENGQLVVSDTTSEALLDRTSIRNLGFLSPNNDMGQGMRGRTTELTSNNYMSRPSSSLSNKSVDNEDSLGELDRTVEPTSVLPERGSGKYLGGCETKKPSIDCRLASDIGESGIISNILAMDLGTPESSLSPLHDLVKLLGENDNEFSLKVRSSQKPLDNKQSRFSFAQEESSDDIWRESSDYSALSDLTGHKNSFLDAPSNKFLGIPSASSKVSGVPCSVPPGFSVPRRTPPPGFPSHVSARRLNQPLDTPVNHLLQSSHIPTHSSGITGDAVINDPAILGVGEGALARELSRGATLSQFNFSEPDASLHLFRQQPIYAQQKLGFQDPEPDASRYLFRQQPISAQQNLGFHDHFSNRYSSLNDAYTIPPQYSDQFQPNNPSSFVQSTSQQFSDVHASNGHWTRWNGVKSVSDHGMSDLLRNDRLGFDNLMPCYDNMKSPTSYFSHLNNTAFEIMEH